MNTTIAQILTYPANTPVINFVGTVVEAHPPKKGEGQYGPWSVMDLVVKDATGATIPVKWWGNLVEDPNIVKGQTIGINADVKAKRPGALVEHHEYQGKQTVRIKVQGERLFFQTVSTTRMSPAAGPETNGKLTVTDYLSVAGRAYRYATAILGITDEQAAAAFANTCGIAASNGKLVIDEEPDDINYDQMAQAPPPPDDGSSVPF